MATVPANINNWVFEENESRERDSLALAKAKRTEEKQERRGYRWVKINDRLKVFVPCDKKGNPTQDGLNKIQILKKSQGIV